METIKFQSSSGMEFHTASTELPKLLISRFVAFPSYASASSLLRLEQKQDAEYLPWNMAHMESRYGTIIMLELIHWIRILTDNMHSFVPWGECVHPLECILCKIHSNHLHLVIRKVSNHIWDRIEMWWNEWTLSKSSFCFPIQKQSFSYWCSTGGKMSETIRNGCDFKVCTFDNAQSGIQIQNSILHLCQLCLKLLKRCFVFVVFTWKGQVTQWVKYRYRQDQGPHAKYSARRHPTVHPTHWAFVL